MKKIKAFELGDKQYTKDDIGAMERGEAGMLVLDMIFDLQDQINGIHELLDRDLYDISD